MCLIEMLLSLNLLLKLGRSHPGRAKQDERSLQRSSMASGGQGSGVSVIRSRDHRDSHFSRASSLPMPITRPRPAAGAARRLTEQHVQQEDAEVCVFRCTVPLQ